MANYLRQLNLRINVAKLEELDSNWDTGKFELTQLSSHYSRLYMPVTGEGQVAFGEVKLHLVPGNIYLIPPYVKLKASCSNYLKKYWTHFKANVLNSELDIFSVAETEYQLQVDDIKYTEKLFKKLTLIHHTPLLEKGLEIDYFDAKIGQSILLLLLEPFIRKIKPLKGQQESSLFRMVEVINFIEANLKTTVSLKELGKKVNLSPTYLSNLFSSQLGVSPIQYCNRQRIAKAKQLLTATDLRISEVAYEVGAKSCDSFYKLFLRHTNMSPQKYRKSSRKREL